MYPDSDDLYSNHSSENESENGAEKIDVKAMQEI